MGEIEPYYPEDCTAISKFSEKYFPHKPNAIIKRSRTDQYFSWKYGPNPCGKSIMLLYREGKELLGCFGAVPHQLVIRGKNILAYQLTDAFVAPAMHGKGIFRLLADMVFKEIDKVSDICFGMSPSEHSLPIFTNKYAMYIAPKYRQVFSPLRFNDILKAKGLRFFSPLGNIMNFLRNQSFSKSAVIIEEIDRIPSSCCLICKDMLDFSIHKGHEYITYRYEQCPEPYHFYKITDHQNNDAILVIKLVSWQNITMCYLVDVIADSEAAYTALFLCQAMYGVGIKTKSAVVSMELHHPRNELSQLLLKGFLCHSREECIFMRQSNWPFLNPASSDYDSKKWIIFSGDSDYI
ncbi:MAG: GNAT family N-acetyltransferase [Smithella sp.]